MEHIHGIRIGGYRSIAFDPPSELAPLSTVNLIAGQNNSGKSNVLRLIHALFLDSDGQSDTDHSGPWDKPLGAGEEVLRFSLGFRIETLVDRLGDRIPAGGREQAIRRLADVLHAMHAIESECVWYDYTRPTLAPLRSRGWEVDDQMILRLLEHGPSDDTYNLVDRFGRDYLGGSGGTWAQVYGRVLLAVRPDLTTLPASRTVVAFRQIAAGDNNSSGLSGLNLIQRLHALQHPRMDRREDRARFDQISGFVQAVLEDTSVAIEIPHDLGTIHVTRSGRTLPLENLGTGIHEVVILAAAATVVENSIMCIEEPEIHLHPTLQRKLLAYLSTRTSNQYFIATHSAHMLDSSRASIFHVRHNGTRSEISYAGHPRERAEICADLGYRASDLVQANAVIWVEGPSDRIYVNYWISQLAPDLVEGTHYSVMFYGGRLLSHLTSHDPEVTDFISLRRLNRYMAVVIDSDKRTSHSHLNATKKRIRDEFDESGPGFAWISKGYTIENYVPDVVLRDALTAAYPTRDAPSESAAQFDNPLADERLGFKADKVKIARMAVEKWPEGTWVLDSKERTRHLIELIQAANR